MSIAQILRSIAHWLVLDRKARAVIRRRRRQLEQARKHPVVFHPRFGLDWAWGSPHLKTLKSQGVTFACRYYSHDPGKDLSRNEAVALSRAGIDIVTVFETSANRVLGGWNAGLADGQAARHQAHDVGQPVNSPIFFAIDFDASDSQVIREYFKGAKNALGPRLIGAYGSQRILTALFDHALIDHGWQTYAWSNGRWEPRAKLQQYSNGHRVDGVDCDYNRTTAPNFGQFRVS